jgi:hypothetical protein
VFENPRIREADAVIHLLPVDVQFLDVHSGHNYAVVIDTGRLLHVDQLPIILLFALDI